MTDTPEAAIREAIKATPSHQIHLRMRGLDALDALVAENARLTAELAEALDVRTGLISPVQKVIATRAERDEALRVADQLRAVARQALDWFEPGWRDAASDSELDEHMIPLRDAALSSEGQPRE